MAKYYDYTIIPPLLKIFKVNKVLLLGAVDKKIFNNLLEGSVDIVAINLKEIDNIKTIQDNPLKVLPKLNDYDAIFINDDANWYTIFTELNIIKETNKSFPLVFICNNKFPNKRRDSYINPNIIPNNFLHEFVSELPICYQNEKIYISDGYYHACEENTPKNGVFTAIEDFLYENNHIGIMNINFIDDITILYLKVPLNQKRIEILIKDSENAEIEDIDLPSKLIENHLLISYINKFNIYENNFNELNVEISQKNSVLEDLKNQIRIKDNNLNFKNSQIESIESKLSLKDSKIKNFESKLINKKNQINVLQDQLQDVNNNFKNEKNLLNDKINSLNQEISEKERSFKDSEVLYESRINSLNQKLTNQEKIFDEQINSLKDIHNQREIELQNQINDKNLDIDHKNTQLRIKQEELNHSDKIANDFKQQYMHQLSKIDNNEYCISCFKDEISNNHVEIRYLKNNSLIKKILNPFSYLYLIFKSSPKELSINFKLYRILKNSDCFDIGYYLNNNKDLQKSNWCKYFSPELHYICNGFNEERKFNKKYFNRNSKKELLEYLLNCDKS